MKSNIHPAYYPHATITCACGASYSVGSTVESTHVEICAACHPFYTGKQKLVDTARRVEKFEERTAKAKSKQAAVSAIKEKKQMRAQQKQQEEEHAVIATKEAERAAVKRIKAEAQH